MGAANTAAAANDSRFTLALSVRRTMAGSLAKAYADGIWNARTKSLRSASFRSDTAQKDIPERTQ